MDSFPQQNAHTQQQPAAPHLSLHWDANRSSQLRKLTLRGAELLELVLAGLVLIGLLLSMFPLIRWMPGLLLDGNDVEIRSFLERALDIVIGVEFIKMLVKHSPGSSLQVLLCAIARHMVVGHNAALENLLSVAAIALIFIVRKYFFVPSFGSHLTVGHHAPEEAFVPKSFLQFLHKGPDAPESSSRPEELKESPAAEPLPGADAEEEPEEEDEPEEPEAEDEPETDGDDCEVGELKIHC